MEAPSEHSNAVSLHEIRAALDRYEPLRLPVPDRLEDRAAVAMIFAGAADELSLCFIRRAEHPKDRWSGQMAFPGGRASEGETTSRAIAERETTEEVALRLQEAQCLGDLSDLPLRRRGLDVDGILTPVVFHYDEELPKLRPNEEVASAHWISLRHLWSPDNIGSIEIEVEGRPVDHPGIRFEDEIIWGLTYRILTGFSDLAARPLPGPRPPD